MNEYGRKRTVFLVPASTHNHPHMVFGVSFLLFLGGEIRKSAYIFETVGSLVNSAVQMRGNFNFLSRWLCLYRSTADGQEFVKGGIVISALCRGRMRLKPW